MAKAKLNAMLQELTGSVGNAVWQRSREGQIVRQKVTPSQPDTPGQLAARARLTTVSRIYKGFTATQEQAWENYAKSIHEEDDVTGKSTTPTAMNAFTKLGCKFLQATPNGTVPTTPPTSPYNGDNLTVTATAGVGKVTFTASAANALGTKTELLLQPLASRNRNPQKNGYRSKMIHQFMTGSLSQDVTVPPGFYAAAYRFINVSTGQFTDLIPIGVSQVTLGVVNAQPKKKAA